MADLDLREVPAELRAQAAEDYEQGNALGFVGYARSNQVALALVAENTKALHERGIYEAALVEAFIGCRVNHHRWKPHVIDRMFQAGDKQKLRDAGTSLPGPGLFTVYRGVAGNGRARRIDGLSYSGSLDAACWFAVRLAPLLSHPAVYQRQVTRDEIYVFDDGRSEQEFICALPRKKPVRVRMSPEEIRERANRWGETNRRKED